MINMLDFNELDAAKPHVHGKKIGHPNMGGKKKKGEPRTEDLQSGGTHTHTRSPAAIRSSCANSSINNSER